MDRQKLITTIEQLYPADTPYLDTRAVGRRLLQQAREENWRDEPDAVLTRYADLCEQYERHENR